MTPSLLKNEKFLFILFLFSIFIIYTVFLHYSGYFQIGLLSDDYLNFISAQSSSLKQKFASYIPYYNNLHMRPVWFLSIDLSIWISRMLGYTKENFLLFRIENLMFFYILIFLSSWLFFKITGKVYFALTFALFCLLYPNNVNDICWTVGRVDLICCIFIFCSLIFTFSYAENKKNYKEYLSGIFFVFALLTKETAIILPFITILFVFISFNKEKAFEIKRLLGIHILLLILYFSYRVYILGVQPMEVVTRFQKPGLFSSLGVTFKALLSLIIPYDYLSVQNYIITNNLFFAAYLVLIIIFLVSVLFIFIRKNKFSYIFILSAVFIISISPNLIAGYFRPQLILIPFILFNFSLLIIATKIQVNLRFFQIVLFLIFIFWGKLSHNLILDWKYAYEKSVTTIKGLVEMNLDSSRRNIILGLPSRFRQAYMLDYASGPYNFWKYGEYKLNDKITDLILTGSLDANSLNSELAINKISDNEYELVSTGDTQYFLRLDATVNKYKDRDIELRFSEKNSFKKPTLSRIKILSDNVDVYVFSNDKFIRLNGNLDQ